MVPTFVSTLCICIVWLPLFQLAGVAGYLFLPMAEAIIFAMLASFILSRTLVPTLAAYLLRAQVASRKARRGSRKRPLRTLPGGIRATLRAISRQLQATAGRGWLRGAADSSLGSWPRHSPRSAYSCPGWGRISSPVSSPARSTCISGRRSGYAWKRRARSPRWWMPPSATLLPGHVTNVIDNCGLPASGINQAYSASATIGPQDCDVTISLNIQASPVDAYRAILRDQLPKLFPGTAFTFPAGDITAKILNFGLPAPIDVQIAGRDIAANMAYAQRVGRRACAGSPASRTSRSSRPSRSRRLLVSSHRAFASGAGLTESDIANNALATLSGSGQAAPTYWLDHKTGVVAPREPADPAGAADLR